MYTLIAIKLIFLFSIISILYMSEVHRTST